MIFFFKCEFICDADLNEFGLKRIFIVINTLY